MQIAWLQRGRDYAFVSRAYADVCSCTTNVTSHNPWKITPVPPNYTYSCRTIFSFFFGGDVAQWKGFQSTDLPWAITPTPNDFFLSIFYNVRPSWSFLLFQASVISPVPPACPNRVGIFNKEIISVLDYEGHFEKIRFSFFFFSSKCHIYILSVVFFSSFCLPPALFFFFFFAQVCDTRGWKRRWEVGEASSLVYSSARWLNQTWTWL